MGGGPGEAGYRARCRKLVTDTLLLPPLEAQLIDEHNVITLSYRELSRVRRELQRTDRIVLLALETDRRNVKTKWAGMKCQPKGLPSQLPEC